jgi:hypothetical protein
MSQPLKNFRNALLAGWKWLLSFSKTEWNLSDYPITTRKSEANSPSRLKLVPWSASIVNWCSLSASGDTKAEALADLQRRFDERREAWVQKNKRMPRPGSHVPVEFAENKRVQAHRELADDFIHRVLELDWAWISDESRLWDFHCRNTNDVLNLKVKELYGVDISGIQSGRLCEIFERIAREDKFQRWRKDHLT